MDGGLGGWRSFQVEANPRTHTRLQRECGTPKFNSRNQKAKTQKQRSTALRCRSVIIRFRVMSSAPEFDLERNSLKGSATRPKIRRVRNVPIETSLFSTYLNSAPERAIRKGR
jgi:hypothetical protein